MGETLNCGMFTADYTHYKKKYSLSLGRENTSLREVAIISRTRKHSLMAVAQVILRRAGQVTVDRQYLIYNFKIIDQLLGRCWELPYMTLSF